MDEPEEKSLSAWRLEIQKYGKQHYLVMYKALLGDAVSNISRFYRLINLYGDFAVFEAIVATSMQTVTGDPLPYVSKVANSKWKETQLAEDEEVKYLAEIEEEKRLSRKRNDELEKKLKKLKKVKRSL